MANVCKQQTYTNLFSRTGSYSASGTMLWCYRFRHASKFTTQFAPFNFQHTNVSWFAYIRRSDAIATEFTTHVHFSADASRINLFRVHCDGNNHVRLYDNDYCCCCRLVLSNAAEMDEMPPEAARSKHDECQRRRRRWQRMRRNC